MVSIIIVSYNTRTLLADCLESIHAKCAAGGYEVLVVDNASADGSREMVEARFPWARLLPNPTNSGFGAANNLGARAAKGKYLLLLNSDTVLLNDAVAEYLRAYEALPGDKGAIGAQLLDANGLVTHSYGFFPSARKEFLARLGFRPIEREDERPRTTPIRVEYITGAALFIRRDVFLGVGGFSPAFFMYYEDVELQRRLWRVGRRNYLIPGPRIVHLAGKSISRSNTRRTLTDVSKLKYYRTSLGLVGGALYKAAFIGLEGLLCLMDAFRTAPNFTRSENVRFLLCLLAGSERWVLGDGGRA